ncbi:MAG: DNA translocase FtsK 4TM domain-containing protein [Bacilli bacterium]
MAKDKKRNIDDKKEETLFYHELIGIIFIIFSISILGQLGKIGSFLTNIFKVTFGDWYWIVILFLLFFGIVNLFTHKNFDFKNQRFIGFLFICFGLLIFAHFPLHNYIEQSSNSYFSETWKIYKTYLDTEANMYLGGGLVGSVMFYIIFYLFGAIGVVLIALLIMLLGLSLIIKMPIIDMFRNLGSKTKKLTRYTGNFSRFFKYNLGSNEEKEIATKKNIFSKQQQVPLKIFEEIPNVMNYNFQDKLSLETRSLIHSVFNNLHIEYKDLSYTITYQVTSFKFRVFSEFNMEHLIERLNNVIEDNILIGYEGSSLMIQIVNKYPQILTIREILLKQSNLYDNYIIPLGLTYENKLCEIDLVGNSNLLLIGSKGTGLKNFISYYICCLFVKMNLINYEIEIFDANNEFGYLSNIIDVVSDVAINDYLNKIIALIDGKLELINNAKTTSLDDYNKKIDINNDSSEKLKRKVIVINNLDVDKETYAYFENKIMYVTQLGEKAGVTVIYLIRDELNYTTILSSLFNHKLVFKMSSQSFSNRVMNNNNALYLQKNGDAFYLSQIKARRIQTPLVSNKDLEKVYEYLK